MKIRATRKSRKKVKKIQEQYKLYLHPLAEAVEETLTHGTEMGMEMGMEILMFK